MAAAQAVTKSTSKPVTVDNDYADLSYELSDYCFNQSYGTLAVFNISFTLLGLISATFLLILVWKNPALRGDKFLLLNNLVWAAVTLLMITGLVYTEEAINPCWYAGLFLCKIVHFFRTWLTNVSALLLVALAIQQLNRYRRKFVTFFSETYVRWLITVAAMWGLAFLISIPEIIMSRVLYYDSERILVLCDVFKFTAGETFARTARILFVEYIGPFLVLIVLTIIMSFYVFMVRSQYTTFGVTIGESLVVGDRDHPRHFVLIVILVVVYVLGYFPLYSYELAMFVEGTISKDNTFNSFWLHMDTVSTFFALLPSALVPTLIMSCSWMHRDAVKAVYDGMTVPIFNKPETRPDEGQEEPVDVSFQG